VLCSQANKFFSQRAVTSHHAVMLLAFAWGGLAR
jgi:hypothetical protein